MVKGVNGRHGFTSRACDPPSQNSRACRTGKWFVQAEQRCTATNRTKENARSVHPIGHFLHSEILGGQSRNRTTDTRIFNVFFFDYCCEAKRNFFQIQALNRNQTQSSAANHPSLCQKFVRSKSGGRIVTGHLGCCKAQSTDSVRLTQINGKSQFEIRGSHAIQKTSIPTMNLMEHDQQYRLFTKQDLCARLSISVRTIENMVKSGNFPPPVRIGKYVYWTEIAVQRWQQRVFADQEKWGTAKR